MKILLVEDDATLADGLLSSLQTHGYQVTQAASLGYAEAALRAHPYDLMILDLGLPDGDGMDFLTQLRSRKMALPVLILTARDGLNDRITGLQLGADDYLIKPFELRELEARLMALLRRSQGGFNSAIELGTLRLEVCNHQFFLGAELLVLPQREHGVLEALMLKLGKAVSKDHIARRLAVGAEELADNAIEVYVHRLRRRLEPSGIRIRTLRGLGYLLETRTQGTDDKP